MASLLPLLFCIGAGLAEDVSFTTEPEDITLTRNTTGVLSCRLSAPVTCAWRLEDTALDSSGFLNSVPPPLVEPLSPLHPSDCSLRLTHPSTDYSGRYQCAPYTPDGSQILSDWATVYVVPTTDGPFACPSESGTFPDSNNCRHFYVCVNGEAIRETCPDPLVFNPSILNCDYEEHVPGCQ